METRESEIRRFARDFVQARELGRPGKAQYPQAGITFGYIEATMWEDLPDRIEDLPELPR